MANYEYVNVVLQSSSGIMCSSTLAKISDFINNYVLSTFYFIAGGAAYYGGGGIKIDTAKVITLSTIYNWAGYSFGKIIIYAM